MNIEMLKENIFSKKLPTHVGIILDGNGRWATKRMLPRNMGHKKGIETLKEIIIETKKIGIPYLTVFAFSTENWKRPKEEVDYLMNIIKEAYHKAVNKVLEQKIRIRFIGSKDNLPNDILMYIEDIENQTKSYTDFTLTIAFNYGSKQEIINACKLISKDVKNNKINISDINDELFSNYLYTKDLPAVDLIIRTSGEQRLSNFLLYQSAYAEFYFPKTLWPDFHKKELYIAINEYQNRTRRFGGLK